MLNMSESEKYIHFDKYFDQQIIVLAFSLSPLYVWHGEIDMISHARSGTYYCQNISLSSNNDAQTPSEAKAYLLVFQDWLAQPWP